MAPIVVLAFIGVIAYLVSTWSDGPLGWARVRSKLAAELDGRVIDGGAAVVCQFDGVEVTFRAVLDREFGALRASVVCPARGRVRGDLDWLVGREVAVTGDDAFDRRVELQGPELEAVAPLDADARALILRGIRADLRFEPGKAVVHVPWWGGPWEPVHAALRTLVDASRPWREGTPDLRARLAALADTDPQPLVRAWSILRLSRLPGDASAPALDLATRGGRAPMEALESSQPDEVAGAAVWLGLRGGVDAVPALRALDLAQRAEPARLAVHEAVLAIQARVAPGAVGGLAVAEEDGDLSLAAMDELAVVRRDHEADGP